MEDRCADRAWTGDHWVRNITLGGRACVRGHAVRRYAPRARPVSPSRWLCALILEVVFEGKGRRRAQVAHGQAITG